MALRMSQQSETKQRKPAQHEPSNTGDHMATITSLRKMEPAGDKLTGADSGKSLKNTMRDSSDPRI